MDDSTRDLPSREPLVISCDACAMRCTAACEDCVVAFVLHDDRDPLPGLGAAPIELDVDQVRVVRLLTKAGMLPDLRYREAV